MKAIVYTRYGGPNVLRLCELEEPVPGDNDILVRIRAATVAMGDSEMRAFRFAPWLWLPLRVMMGVARPRYRILGSDLSGEVVATGRNVTLFGAGDSVYATSTRFGAHAEYKCLSADGPVATKPVNLTHAEAATIPTGAYNALHFLRRANLQAGQRVLVNGAGGAIGVMAVQLARYFGAQVTAVDSADKLDLLRSIGADSVIDYRVDDFTRTGQTWDVIFDVFGNSPYSRCIKALEPAGYYLLGNPRLLPMLRGIFTTRMSDKTVVFAFAAPCAADLDFIRELIEDERVKAVVDRIYPMEQFIDAHTYVDSGRKMGSVVMAMDYHD